MIEYLPLVLTGIGLTASIVYYANILRNANKTQEMQLETRNAKFFMQFVMEMSSSEFLNFWIIMLQWEWTDYDDFERKYGSVNQPELFGPRYHVWKMFDVLGWLVESGVVGIEDVNALMSQSLLWSWTKFESIIREWRRLYNMPDAFIYWERLNQKVLEYRREQGILMKVPEYLDDYLATQN